MFDSTHLWFALVAVAWCTWILWLAGAALTVRAALKERPLAAPNAETANLFLNLNAPFVSILVPARNEANRILERAVRSMLAQDYPSFEIVAVNDRSTDATGEILRRIAATDERLRVIEGVELPDGWLGKPHAMQQAFEASRGDWILATDADILYSRDALRAAMNRALAERLDALTLLPHVDCLSFWERVFLPVFGWFMLLAMPLERVNDPRKREALGVGGFFLMRRAALEMVGGYAALRGEVAEDLRLAMRLKRAGFRLRVESAPDLIRTRMQTNLRELWEGFTKNLFAGAEFSLARAVAGAASVALFAVAPALIALVCAIDFALTQDTRALTLGVPCALVYLTQVAAFAFINKRWQIPSRYAFAAPLGHALFALILLNSALRVTFGSGVQWKGRAVYSRASGVRPQKS